MTVPPLPEPRAAGVTPDAVSSLAAPSALVPMVPPPPVEEEPAAVTFPLSWIFEHGSPAIQYRSAVEVARLPGAETQLDWLPYTSRCAIRLAVTQGIDGIWNDRMMAVPSSRGEFEGVGTIPALQRMLEYGWSPDSPPVALARRVLFRLLAEDEDPGFLHELATKSQTEDQIRRGRSMLREAAAATLARAGFENDPRLRGAVRRIVERMEAFLASPLGEKPWVRIGNTHVLAAEAAPPSIFVLRILAHMPLLRYEHHSALERLYEHLSQPLPRQDPVQLVGRHQMAQPHLVLGDKLPHRNAVEADIPFALMWLELMARLGFLRRNEGWLKMFDRFLEDCDRQGVWHPHKGTETPRTKSPYAWPIFPLQESLSSEGRWADVTFRIGLIARLAGREIKVV